MSIWDSETDYSLDYFSNNATIVTQTNDIQYQLFRFNDIGLLQKLSIYINDTIMILTHCPGGRAIPYRPVIQCILMFIHPSKQNRIILTL